MIKIERVKVLNFDNAIRGARNPMNSWDRGDSYYDENGNFVLGENDFKLARKLCLAGSTHRKFIRQIFVTMDITAPLYWWKEFDTYKVGTTANSTSTMHKIHSKSIEMNVAMLQSLKKSSVFKGLGRNIARNIARNMLQADVTFKINVAGNVTLNVTPL